MAWGAFIKTFGPYKRAFIARDLVAGLTVWAVLVPEVLAYASIAGVSPVIGLYAVAPSAVLYMIFGSSRQLIVGPMSATAALSAAAVIPLAGASGADTATLTAALAIVTGIVALVAGLLRLGFVAGFISEPVLKGFIIGMALTIVVGQLPKLFGVDKGGEGFFSQLWHVITSLGSTNWPTLAVGLASLALIVALRRLVPKVPGSLIVVLLAIGAVWAFHLADAGVDTVGTITPGLPHFAVPDTSLANYVQLLGAAGGVAVVGFAEGLGAAKEYASRNGYQIDPNRELLGLGAANFGSGLFGGMVVNGSLSKTAVNGNAGAKSQVSGLVAAVMTIVTLLFLTPLFEQLPDATLAAVVILAVWELIDIKSLRAYYHLWTSRLGSIFGRTARGDFIASVAAMLGVLIFDTLPGLIIGVLVSLLLLLYRVSRPHVAILGRMPGDGGVWVEKATAKQAVVTDHITVARIESALFFANADYVREALMAAVGPDTKALVVDASTITQLDLTAARMLGGLFQELKAKGVQMIIASPLAPLRDEARVAEGGRLPYPIAPTIDEAIGLVSAS